MKKRILIITTLVFAVLGAGVAVAAYTSGTYSGRTTSQRGPISFKASQSRLTQLKVGVVWNCTDGDRFQSDLRGFPGQNIVNGNYNASFTGSNGASRYTNRGRLSRVRIGRRTVNQAKGTFTGRRLYDTNDQLDPNGTITCTTGSLAYTIRRTGR